MGMSASQARLLYLTAQLNHLSLKGQNVSDSKIRLSMDTESIQEKYTNALNSSRLFVSNNIFSAEGSKTNRELISLANLKAQDLLVYDGSKILGYSYEEVDTGKTKKVFDGYEQDLTKPIYGQKDETSTFRTPSSTLPPVGVENVNKMKDITNALGLPEDDLKVVSYTTPIDGKNKDINAIAIRSQAGFEAIAKNWSADMAQQNYVLDLDDGESIDLSSFDWGGLSRFQGIFDGNGKSIKNLEGSQGLFSDLYGTVKNVNLEGVDVTGETDILGSIAGYLADGGKIENCNATDVNITCTLKPDTAYPEAYYPERAGVGGLVGMNNGDIKNSSVQGTINVPNADESFGYIGGFAGANVNPAKGECSIENSYSDVNIVLSNDKNYSNSINGFIGNDTHEATIKNCTSLGSITTADGSTINGTDLANWGPVIESDINNFMGLDTRNNNNVLYWGNTTDGNWGNGSTTAPGSMDSATEKLPDGTTADIWLKPGEEGYADQDQATASGNNLPVINLTGLQKAGLAKETTSKVDDPTNITGYQNGPAKYIEVPIKETVIVEDKNYKGLSSAELEKGLRDGTYTLIKKAVKDSTQAMKINGTDFELVSWQTCTTIIDKQEEQVVAIAESEYNKGLAEIQAKDKRYEIDQKKIDTQYKALQTEEESIKSVLQKNVERSFKAFG